MHRNRLCLAAVFAVMLSAAADAAQVNDRWQSGNDKLRLFEENFSRGMATTNDWNRRGVDARWEIVAEYPEFNHPVIDRVIRDWVDWQVAEHIDVRSASQLRGDRRNSLMLEFDFSVAHPSAQAMSVVFSVAAIPGGSEQPATRLYALNFALETGELLPFDALFRNPVLALDLIARKAAELVDARLRERFPEDFAQPGDAHPRLLRAGLEPTRDNFGCLELEADGVRVHFQPSQILPHAYGLTDVLVPLADLETAGPSDVVWPVITLKRPIRSVF